MPLRATATGDREQIARLGAHHCSFPSSTSRPSDRRRCARHGCRARIIGRDRLAGGRNAGSPSMNCEQRGQMRCHLRAYLSDMGITAAAGVASKWCRNNAGRRDLSGLPVICPVCRQAHERCVFTAGLGCTAPGHAARTRTTGRFQPRSHRRSEQADNAPGEVHLPFHGVSAEERGRHHRPPRHPGGQRGVMP
jgi:hypothetical protein